MPNVKTGRRTVHAVIVGVLEVIRDRTIVDFTYGLAERVSTLQHETVLKIAANTQIRAMIDGVRGRLHHSHRAEAGVDSIEKIVANEVASVPIGIVSIKKVMSRRACIVEFGHYMLG